ncbi:group III truncated hemoglobin [Frankia canadensis]|nr:group III truncated hemoglobin [Frankia canadensis]
MTSTSTTSTSTTSTSTTNGPTTNGRTATDTTTSGPAAGGGRVRRDIADRDDITELVTAFYRRAFADPLLGPVFVDVAKLDLDAHLPVICDFWQAVIFRAGTYRRNAFGVHADLHARVPLTEDLFARWLALWTGTVDELRHGPRADRAKLQAGRIAESMRRRLPDRPTGPDPVD